MPEEEGQTAQALRCSEANAVLRYIQQKIKEFKAILAEFKESTPSIINIDDNKIIDLNSIIEQIEKPGTDLHDVILQYASGLKAYLKIGPNKHVIMRVNEPHKTVIINGKTINKLELARMIISLDKEMADRISVEAAITDIKALDEECERLANESEVLFGFKVSRKNISFAISDELGQEIDRAAESDKSFADKIRNNELKIFGVSRDSTLPDILLFGDVIANINIFDGLELSKQMSDLLDKLVSKEAADDIKNAVKEGRVFIKMNLISIKETLREFQLRRVVIDVAA